MPVKHFCAVIRLAPMKTEQNICGRPVLLCRRKFAEQKTDFLIVLLY